MFRARRRVAIFLFLRNVTAASADKSFDPLLTLECHT